MQAQGRPAPIKAPEDGGRCFPIHGHRIRVSFWDWEFEIGNLSPGAGPHAGMEKPHERIEP